MTVSALSRGEKRVTQRVTLLVSAGAAAVRGSCAVSDFRGAATTFRGSPRSAIDKAFGLKPQARKTHHAPAVRKRSPRVGQRTARGMKEESFAKRAAMKSPTMPPRPLSRSQRAGVGNAAKNAGTASAAAAQYIALSRGRSGKFPPPIRKPSAASGKTRKGEAKPKLCMSASATLAPRRPSQLCGCAKVA